jgi:transcriptional regulator with XRE-family HTH domain
MRGFDGRKIREAREGAKLSQEKLARELGTGVRNVSRWETGVSEPRFTHVVMIARATGKPLAFFQPDVQDAA